MYDYNQTLAAFQGGNQIANSMRLRDLQMRAGQLAQGGNYEGAAQALLGGGDFQTGVPLLGAARQMTQQQQSLEADKQLMQLLGGGGARAPQQGASVAPTAATPNDIQTRFMSTAQQAGLNNPYGLAALAATGQRESAFSPNKVNATWSDPSERGQAGTSGGILSWRNERLANLQKFAQQRGEQQPSVETQALFFSQEDPTLIPRLNAAKSPQEAAQIMANAWRFAGYNRPGGEAAAREQLTAQYAERFKGQQPQQAAQPMQTVRGVPVANSEADVQRLEAQMAGQQPAPIQMAQAPGAMADLPAQGAPPSQFAVPGQPAPQAPTLPPNDPFPNASTQQLYQALATPGLKPERASLIKAIIDRRNAFEGSRNPLDDQYKREQIAKLQREGASANEPPVPPGYRAVRDAQGKLTSFEPVPGGPAEQKIAEGNKKDQLRAEQTQKYGNVVLTAIGDIESLMKGATLPTTGAIGSVLAERAPGTAAHDIKNTLETIRANISFERLNEMRAASPTGGALGAVSDKEGALLANSLAAVQQSSSEGQFRANLMRLRNQFERTVHGRLLTDQERKFASQGDGSPKQAQGAGAVSEGMTATNPQTGQKIMLRGGQWVPVQ